MFRWLIARHFGAECAYSQAALASIRACLEEESGRVVGATGRTIHQQETNDECVG
jgi:hypothetical protein